MWGQVKRQTVIPLRQPLSQLGRGRQTGLMADAKTYPDIAASTPVYQTGGTGTKSAFIGSPNC